MWRGALGTPHFWKPRLKLRCFPDREGSGQEKRPFEVMRRTDETQGGKREHRVFAPQPPVPAESTECIRRGDRKCAYRGKLSLDQEGTCLSPYRSGTILEVTLSREIT